jgi:hypothetical protein
MVIKVNTNTVTQQVEMLGLSMTAEEALSLSSRLKWAADACEQHGEAPEL